MKRVTLKTKCPIALASGLLACGAAIAAPTAQVVAGQTTEDLDAGFLAALESLNVAPAPFFDRVIRHDLQLPLQSQHSINRARHPSNTL